MRHIQVRNKTLEVIELANKLFNTKLPPIQIRFDLKGKVAGWAGIKNNQYYLRFNVDMINNGSFEKILNETVPHEVAHLVNFYIPHTGNAHNHGWYQTCKALGGTGKRIHSEPVVYAKGLTYEYINTNGKPIRVSQTIHNRIQNGQHRISKDGGRLHKDCKYTVLN